MDDLDKRLRKLGQSWRQSQPPPLSVDPTWFGTSEQPGMGLVFANVAGAIVLVVFFGVILMVRILAPAGTGSGHPAVARGVVVADPGGTVRICDPLPILLGGGAGGDPVECSPIAVEVRGLDVSGLPDWAAFNGGGFSSLVTVTGNWTGEALEAESSARASVVPAELPPVPCETPVAGWPSGPPDEIDFEAALLRLTNALALEPTRYSGYWIASLPPVVGEDGRAVVVGTTGSLTADQGHLDEVFPYPLCQTKVDYSAADLARAEDVLSQHSRSWQTKISQEQNRVVVRLSVIDAAAQQFLDAHPESVADPLLRLL